MTIVDFLINLLMLGLILAWYGFAPSWHIVFLPLATALAVLASFGPALFVTSLNVKYRDFRYVIPFVVQFGLYISPVGFSSEVVPPKWRLLYDLNPAAGMIDVFRWCIIGGKSEVSLQLLAFNLSWSGFSPGPVFAISGGPNEASRTWCSSIVSDIVIDVESLGKSYEIGSRAAGAGYVTLRDTLAQKAGQLFRPRDGSVAAPAPAHGSPFWALKDVSFQIKRGEVIGILGRNGAGKSTLLKILSRITDPSEGRATIRGRVASLLEVGTGFHPELTGRENIFLNGAILGMSRAEIKRRFDEIVAFADVERFLDTPVKRFSSGMYVRLAFAVAAHLEAEILILDEVLAVGDAEFQRKCLGKMGEAAGGGRTVLIVSHNMAIIEQVCGSALLLASGHVEAHGETASVVRRYLDEPLRGASNQAGFRYRNRGDILSIERVDLLVDGQPALHIGAGDHCEFVVHFRRDVSEPGRFVPVFLLSVHHNGMKVASLWTGFHADPAIPSGSGTVRCVVPKWPLRGGTVRIDIYTHIGPHVQDWIEEVLVIESRDGPFFGGGPLMPEGEGTLYI